jgi:hypothetical protein
MRAERSLVAIVVLLAATIAAPSAARSQSGYPNRPVTLSPTSACALSHVLGLDPWMGTGFFGRIMHHTILRPSPDGR